MKSLLYEELPKSFDTLNIAREQIVVPTSHMKYTVWKSVSSGAVVTTHYIEVRTIWFAIFEMADINEHRICIKFCFKLSKNAADAHQILQQAFGNQVLNRARTLE